MYSDFFLSRLRELQLAVVGRSGSGCGFNSDRVGGCRGELILISLEENYGESQCQSRTASAGSRLFEAAWAYIWWLLCALLLLVTNRYIEN